MTQLLDIPDPSTSTAGDFAYSAVEAGMSSEDVDQLTTVFEEVRYGGMDPEPREDLALETLRDIEDTYGGASDVDADPADDSTDEGGEDE
jgi:hypothetical protein